MKKVLSILLIISITILITGCVDKKTDAYKFKEEYERINNKDNGHSNKYREISIPDDNPFIYATDTEIVKKIENKESFIVYFGFPTCPWCRSVLEELIKAAKDKEINQIYYVNVLDIRDVKEVDDDGNIKTTKEGTDAYKKLIEEQGAEAVIIFANRAEAILNYTKKILTCDIHTRFATKRLLKDKGAELVLALDDILTAPVNGSGYNEKYGLLGTNKATEETVKLFPRDGQSLVEGVQADLLEKTGKHFEVMVYGDGAFKDPQGKIWELADPVVSPFHTVGLKGTPNELKLKYLADNAYKGLKGKELADAIKEDIKAKEKDLVGKMASEGTTPRQITDLLGSLCDLTSGSGDKGTPVVLIQGYFDNYADE